MARLLKSDNGDHEVSDGVAVGVFDDARAGAVSGIGHTAYTVVCFLGNVRGESLRPAGSAANLEVIASSRRDILALHSICGCVFKGVDTV